MRSLRDLTFFLLFSSFFLIDLLLVLYTFEKARSKGLNFIEERSLTASNKVKGLCERMNFNFAKDEKVIICLVKKEGNKNNLLENSGGG